MKYKLLKDTPTIKAGTIGTLDTYEENYIFKSHLKIDGHIESFDEFGKEIVEKSPDWFEPVIERWRANHGEAYYTINGRLLIDKMTDHFEALDNYFFQFGNYFKTREQAEEASRRIKKVLMDYHKEIGE